MIPIRRRLVGSTLGLLAVIATVPRIALAQAQSVRIGYLVARQNSLFFAPILKRLEELGFAEGRNLVVDYRSADGVAERFPSLARDLIRAKCDLIVAVGPVQTARAVLEAKAQVPLVIVGVDYDPVKAGVVSSLRRPGGNVTGLTLALPGLSAKRLELLREPVPKAKRFLVLGIFGPCVPGRFGPDRRPWRGGLPIRRRRDCDYLDSVRRRSGRTSASLLVRD